MSSAEHLKIPLARLPEPVAHALVTIAEEAGEVIQRVAKIQRFGLSATDHTNGMQYDNVAGLATEFEDLKGAMERLERLESALRVPEPKVAVVELRPVRAEEEPLAIRRRVLMVKGYEQWGQVMGYKRMPNKNAEYYVLGEDGHTYNVEAADLCVGSL